mgnify:CR=1 FL=1
MDDVKTRDVEMFRAFTAWQARRAGEGEHAMADRISWWSEDALRAVRAERRRQETLKAEGRFRYTCADVEQNENVVMDESGWCRSRFFWGRIEGWVHPDGLRAAFVVAGPDSLERAAAMIGRLPVDGSHHRILDREAVRLRDLDHERWSEAGDASDAAFAVRMEADESSGRAWPLEEIDG